MVKPVRPLTLDETTTGSSAGGRAHKHLAAHEAATTLSGPVYAVGRAGLSCALIADTAAAVPS
jgi:hypothetical protein